jgi:hypothetical protein
MSNLEQCVRDAIEIKLDPKSQDLFNVLRCLQESAGCGRDSVLRDLINSTTGGAYVRGTFPSEAEIVDGSTAGEKTAAISILERKLWDLRERQIQSEAVSVLISKLQIIAG